MIEPWELLLHHSYSGAPGVIFDQSPGRRSHGRPVNLDASDFSPDGAASGTGSVGFRRDSAIRIAPSSPWEKLTAIKCEFVCKYDRDAGGTLIDADSFTFALNKGVPSYSYNAAYGGAGEGFGPVFSEGIEPAIPADQWVTVGMMYGAVQGSGFFYNGKQLKDFEPFGFALKATKRISIGNNLAGTSGFLGRIDDVKVWRLNPNWVDNSFTNRPLDPAAQDCWKRWRDALDQALKEDKECVLHVRQLIQEAVNAVLRRAMTNPATKGVWNSAAKDYQEKWPEGDLAGVADVLIDLINTTKGDLQLLTDPAFAALAQDDCLRRIFGRLPPLDCDNQFTGLLRKVAGQI